MKRDAFREKVEKLCNEITYILRNERVTVSTAVMVAAFVSCIEHLKKIHPLETIQVCAHMKAIAYQLENEIAKEQLKEGKK